MSFNISLIVVPIVAIFCKLDGTIILVDDPLAKSFTASKLFKVKTDSSALASLSKRIPSASACFSFNKASACPSAIRI